jgi:serine/threonine-protein kinase
MLASGRLLQNRYRILRQIGGGGMARVYLAEDTRLAGRRCAIKEMSPSQLAPQDRAWAVNAFKQEAEMLAHLTHPGLTPVTDFFSESGNRYLVMDYVEGETLLERLNQARRGRLPLEEALDVADQLCDVLEYLHSQRPPVIFRDLKPDNVMITPNGKVKLIDFGIARFFKRGQTRDTVNLGTPGYAAPEQYGGSGQSDARADIYSLGVLLLHMVTGYDPTTATTPFSLPSLSDLRPDLPSTVEQVFSRATQPQPDLRYDSVNEFRQALASRQTRPPTPNSSPRPSTPRQLAGMRGLLIGALGALGLVAIVIFLAAIIITSNLGTITGAPMSTATPELSPEASAASSPAREDTATPVPATSTPIPRTTAASPPKETPVPATRTLSPSEREQALLSRVVYREGNGQAVLSSRVETRPAVDGRLEEWHGDDYSIAYDVHDPDGQWNGHSDLYGRFYVGWDNDHLYLAVDVTDDVHVQSQRGKMLYTGDDVEIQIDGDLFGDFHSSELSADDAQVGLSPGDFRTLKPEAYIWLPHSREQPGTMIDVAATPTDGGYTLEAAIPWWTLGGRPQTETPVGFCVSLGDNDLPDGSGQQTMLSSAPTREWGDPTTWGTLILIDWG